MPEAYNTNDKRDRESLLEALKETNAAPDFRPGLSIDDKLQLQARLNLQKAMGRVARMMNRSDR